MYTFFIPLMSVSVTSKIFAFDIQHTSLLRKIKMKTITVSLVSVIFMTLIEPSHGLAQCSRKSKFYIFKFWIQGSSQCVQDKIHDLIWFDFLFFSFFTDRICGDICTQYCTCGSSRLPKDKFCCSNTSCSKNENEDGEVNCPTKGTLNPVYRDINTLQITEL